MSRPSEVLEFLANEISNVRYGEIKGENGYIYFEFRGESYKTLEEPDENGYYPVFSCKYDNSLAARKWVLGRILDEKAERRN